MNAGGRVRDWALRAGLAAALLGGAAGRCRAEQRVVASWNVENLFDTEDDPANEGDDGYTPRGWARWTPARYALKLERLAEIVARLAPDVLCLMEIENRRVLEDLARVLRERHGVDLPAVVHRDGGDHRGIDVAMLAREAPAETRWFCAVPGQRDALACTFAFGGRPLTVLANHWKSQLGKKEESDAIRAQEARAVRAFVDRLLAEDPAAAVVVAGDFNDAPESPALAEQAGILLDEARVRADPSGRLLFNLAGWLPEEARGTYYYSPAKKWNVLDALAVSRGLLPGAEPASPWRVRAGSYEVVRTAAQRAASGAPLPFRRVRSKEVGDVFVTGYSDHFPVRAVLEPSRSETRTP